MPSGEERDHKFDCDESITIAKIAQNEIGYERVISAYGLRDIEIPDLGPKSTVADLVRHTFAVAVGAIIESDPAMRLGDDPEAVHRARVATRELRSNLRTLRPVLVDEQTDDLRTELKRFGETLGAARDLDVLEMEIRELVATVEVGATSPAALSLLDRLAAERRDRRDELRVAMSGERYGNLLRCLLADAEQPVLRSSPTAKRRAREVIEPLTWHSWTRVARPLRHREVGDASDPVLHEVRKRAKGARYAAQLAARVIPGSTPAFSNEMKRYQNVLGRLQDCVTAKSWLASVVSGGMEPDVAFLAGKLWTRFDDRKARARSEFDHRWNPKRASRKAAWFNQRA